MLGEAISVTDCEVTRNRDGSDHLVRSAWFEVMYPARHAHSLPEAMRPFVLLEVGRARVEPAVRRPLSSWVHDHLDSISQLDDYTDNRPTSVRCVHPLVTCLEKLEAIARKYDKGRAAPDFVRHYEDAVHIVRERQNVRRLLDTGLAGLVTALREEDRKVMPAPNHGSFNPDHSHRWVEIEAAWEAIGPMYWGDRVSLVDAMAELRLFLNELAELEGNP
ncbi:MAG: nucleotidyl transferase AbiEii/AbiGii toxin family protein [Deltaproteobacteria bacterium]|nr:nucleotidyl transferase AbiEii/AbiGii toxin family protein [Deltaproteobacteria bacterium]